MITISARIRHSQHVSCMEDMVVHTLTIEWSHPWYLIRSIWELPPTLGNEDSYPNLCSGRPAMNFTTRSHQVVNIIHWRVHCNICAPNPIMHNNIIYLHMQTQVTWASKRDISSSASLLPIYRDWCRAECESRYRSTQPYPHLQMWFNRACTDIPYRSMLVVQIRRGVTRMGGAPYGLCPICPVGTAPGCGSIGNPCPWHRTAPQWWSWSERE